MNKYYFTFGRAISVTCLMTVLNFTGVPVTLASEDGANQIEEVIVTARRREEAAQEVPIPITALNEEQLIARNITEIRDIEKMSPNTSIQ